MGTSQSKEEVVVTCYCGTQVRFKIDHEYKRLEKELKEKNEEIEELNKSLGEATSELERKNEIASEADEFVHLVRREALHLSLGGDKTFFVATILEALEKLDPMVGWMS